MREVGVRRQASGPLCLKEVLPMSKLNLGSTKELLCLRLQCGVAVLKRFVSLSGVMLLFPLYIKT